ncbi:MAG: type II secretion system protein [bacterium]
MKRREGFTLSELMVVMAIIAVLTSLGGFFLQDIYNSYMADQGAQDVLGAIRDVQNKSLTIKDGKKVWAVSISAKKPGSLPTVGGEIKILSYNNTISAPTILIADPPSGIRQIAANSVTLVTGSTLPTTPASYVEPTDHFVFSFSAPFGRPSFYRGSTTGIPLDDCAVAIPIADCKWERGVGFLGEWVLNPDPLVPLDSAYKIIDGPDALIKINIVYGKHTRTVTVRSNGDVSTN